MTEKIKIIGRAKQIKKKPKPKQKEPSHSELCKAITEYLRTKYPKVLFTHIANEGKRSPRMGKQLKDEGMLPGVYDYFIAHMKVTFQGQAQVLQSVIPGLWVEVKTKKDKLSKAQKEFRDRAVAAHYSVAEVYNIDEFIKVIDEYML